MIDTAGVLASAATLRDAAPEAVLAWAVDHFPGRLALTVSFGGNAGVVLAHMLSSIDRSVPVIFLDTGLLFEETYAMRRDYADRFGLNVVDARATVDPGPLYATDPDRCCELRKVEPMKRAIGGFDAWVSGVRRGGVASRRATQTVELHDADGRPLVKVHPLAHVDRDDMQRYIERHHLTSHPLLARGYSSIGCWPCTRPVRDGEDERAGRWSGTGKTECGLHTFTTRERSA